MFSLPHLPVSSRHPKARPVAHALPRRAVSGGFITTFRTGFDALVGGVPVAPRVLALVILLSFAAVASFAAEEEKIIFPAGGARPESPVASGGSGLNSVTLFVGVALAGVGGWMVWRNRRGTPVARGQRALAVDETRSLGNRQYLVVASYEGRKFLLGVCPGRINLLSKLSASNADEELSE